MTRQYAGGAVVDIVTRKDRAPTPLRMAERGAWQGAGGDPGTWHLHIKRTTNLVDPNPFPSSSAHERMVTPTATSRDKEYSPRGGEKFRITVEVTWCAWTAYRAQSRCSDAHVLHGATGGPMLQLASTRHRNSAGARQDP